MPGAQKCQGDVTHRMGVLGVGGRRGKDLAWGLWCRPWIWHLEGVCWNLDLG